MLTILVITACYFLPSILARNRNNFLSIFLLNFFLGWTVIFWIVALIWALSEPAPAQTVIIAAPAQGVKFCCHCGTPTAGRYCQQCGRAYSS